MGHAAVDVSCPFGLPAPRDSFTIRRGILTSLVGFVSVALARTQAVQKYNKLLDVVASQQVQRAIRSLTKLVKLNV